MNKTKVTEAKNLGSVRSFLAAGNFGDENTNRYLPTQSDKITFINPD